MFTPPPLQYRSIDLAGGAPPINRSFTIKLNYATFMSTRTLHWCGGGRGGTCTRPSITAAFPRILFANSSGCHGDESNASLASV